MIGFRSAGAAPVKPRKSRRRRTKGALTVIGGLLIGSAVVRLGGDAGQAFALESAEVPEQAETAISAACSGPEDVGPLLKALMEREERVKTREAAILKGMETLSMAETKIDEKMAALIDAEEKLRATITIADTAAEDDVKRLTDVYATMKPKQAAALFQEMAPEFAAGFLGRMQPESAAAIMAGLDPKAAYTISVMLAGRNANAPKN